MGVGVGNRGGVSEVGKSLAGLGSTKKNSICSGGGSQGELIESNALSSSSDDALTGSLGESKSAYGKLGYIKHTYIIGNLGNDDGNLVLLVLHVTSKTVKSHRWGVGLGHMKTLDDGGAEGGVSTTSEELVKFDKKDVVRVGGPGCLH